MHQVDGLAFIAGDQAALDQVLQFAYIPGKVITQQGFQRAHGQSGRCPAVLLTEALEKEIDQQWNVIAALAQWRQCDRVDIKAIEQVFAEIAIGHRLAQIDVGRRHHSNVDLDAVYTPDALDFPFLQGAQQLALPGKA